MTYRNGTYIAFHADSTSDQSASDIKYYRLLQAWHDNDDVDFRFVNSHEKASSVRDDSQRETLRAAIDHLIRRLSPHRMPPGSLSFLTLQARCKLGLS